MTAVMRLAGIMRFYFTKNFSKVCAILNPGNLRDTGLA